MRRIVGRQREGDILDEALRQAEGGRGGFVRRPPVLGFPHQSSGTLLTPVRGVLRVHHFIRIDKLSLLQRIAGPSVSRADARAAVFGLFDRLAEVGGCDFRGDDARWLGDIVIGSRRKRKAWWNSLPSDDGVELA